MTYHCSPSRTGRKTWTGTGRFGVMRGAIVLVAAAPLEQGDDLIRRDLTRVEEILPLDDLPDFVLVIPGQERPDQALSGFAEPHKAHIVRQSEYEFKRDRRPGVP